MILKSDGLSDVRERQNLETIEESNLTTLHEDPSLKYSGGTTINAIANDNLRDIFDFIGTGTLENRRVNKKFAEVGENYYSILKFRKLVDAYLGTEAAPKVTARWQIQSDGSLQWRHFAFYSPWDWLGLKKKIVLLFTGSSLSRVYNIMRAELQHIQVNSYSESSARELMKLKAKVRRQANNYHKRHGVLYKALVKLITKQDLDVSLKALVAEIDVKIRHSLKKDLLPEEVSHQNFSHLETVFPKEMKDTDAYNLWIDPETGKFLAVRLSGSHQTSTLLDKFIEADELGPPNAVIIQGYAGKYRNYRVSIFKNVVLTELAKESLTLMEDELKQRDQSLKEQFPNARSHKLGFAYKVHDPLCPEKTHQISSQDGKVLYEQEPTP